jgi:DNA repair photolyase
MIIKEIEAKSVIVPSKLPDTDYVVNPYTGCQFGCLYCYATFTCRFVGQPRSSWGDFVYVKKNAVELAHRQLERWPDSRRQATVFFSSVTDPYQGIERRYRLTRGLLQAFARHQYPGKVTVLTKSPLVLDDVEVLLQLNCEVGVTVTTDDDRLSRFLEVKAPAASRRLDTLKQLAARGVPTYAFVGPLLPHFLHQPDRLDALFAGIAETGTNSMYVEHINLPMYVRHRLWDELQGLPPEEQALYRRAETPAHRQAIGGLVDRLAEKHGLHIKLGGAMVHRDLRKE